MFEIVKICKKHGALTRHDVLFRKNRKSSDCKHCSSDWKKQDKLKNPDKYKHHAKHYRKITVDPDIKERECCRCKRLLFIDSFSSCERDNRYAYCKPCRAIANNISRIRNKETYKVSRQKTKIKQREKSLIKKYGINLDQYKKINDAQNGVCRICGNSEIALQPNGKEIKDLCVDHCHKTGKVRGLLCHACNAGIGHFGDDIKKLEAAIKYLSD